MNFGVTELGSLECTIKDYLNVFNCFVLKLMPNDYGNSGNKLHGIEASVKQHT